MTGLVHSTLHKQCLVECTRTAASVPQHGTRQQTQTVLVSRVPYLYVQVSLVSQSVETDTSKNSEQLAARQENPATRSISSFGSTTFTLPLYHIRTYYVHMYIHTYCTRTCLHTLCALFTLYDMWTMHTHPHGDKSLHLMYIKPCTVIWFIDKWDTPAPYTASHQLCYAIPATTQLMTV